MRHESCAARDDGYPARDHGCAARDRLARQDHKVHDVRRASARRASRSRFVVMSRQRLGTSPVRAPGGPWAVCAARAGPDGEPSNQSLTSTLGALHIQIAVYESAAAESSLNKGAIEGDWGSGSCG